MAWNWKSKQRQILTRRKPSIEGNGENAPGVKELADKYMRRGLTRQRAYARARRELDAPFRRKYKRFLQGGGASSK